MKTIVIIIEFITIVVLLLILFLEKQKHSKKKELKSKIKKEEFDQNDMKDIWLAKDLYDNLKKVCHPDRFVDDDKKFDLANSLFQEITKNKNNYQRLLELEQQAKEQLNIIINQ